jgi:hypothetical protein
VELMAEKPAEAEPWLRQAVKKSPGNYFAADLLFRSLKRQPGRAREAEELQQRYASLRALYDRYNALLVSKLDVPGQNNARAATEAAELCFQMDHDVATLNWLQFAFRCDRNYIPAHRLAIAYYQKQNQPENVSLHRRILANLTGGKEPVASPPEKQKE